VQKSPGFWGSRGFGADAEGLHSGTAQAAVKSLAFSQDPFGLGIAGARINASRHVRLRSISCDAISEVEPCIGDKEKTRFVGEHRGPFCQIKARGGQSPVLEFQTHFRTHNPLYGDAWKNSGLESVKTSKAMCSSMSVPRQSQYRLGLARKIFSARELIANIDLWSFKKEAA
jgi:hypothetical protein